MVCHLDDGGHIAPGNITESAKPASVVQKNTSFGMKCKKRTRECCCQICGIANFKAPWKNLLGEARKSMAKGGGGINIKGGTIRCILLMARYLRNLGSRWKK